MGIGRPKHGEVNLSVHRNFAQQISAVTQLLLSETNRPGVVGMVFAFGATDSNIGLPEIGVGPFFVRRRLIILTKA